MISAIDALNNWEEAFSTDDAAPLQKMFTDDFVMIDSDGRRQSLDDVAGWATTEDFHIGDFDIIHDDDHCCCGTHSATLDGRDIGTVCFFALKSQGQISLWKIQRTPPSED